MPKSFSIWHGMLLIAALTVLLYGPFLGHDFLNYDDTTVIVNNPAVRNFDLVRSFTTFDPELYIPLTLLTHQVEYMLFGANAFVAHSTSLLLHIGNAILVLLIVSRLTRNRVMGIVTGLLFALHPIQTEAVLWASARKDLLSAFFFLLTLLLYMKGSRWSILSFTLGLLAKVSIVMPPLILLLIDLWEGKRVDRQALQRMWPYFGLSTAFGILALVGKTENIVSLSLGESALLSSKSMLFSLKQLLFPQTLSPIYPQESAITITAPEFLLPVILCLAACTLLIVCRKRWPVLLWCCTWFVLCYAPHLFTFTRNGFLMLASDRASYLACIGLFLFVSSVTVPLALRNNRARPVLLLLLIVTTGTLMMFSRAQAAIWKDSETLARVTIDRGYAHPLMLNNLGSVLQKTGSVDEALQTYLQAAEKGLPQAYYNAATLSLQQGEQEKGISLLQEGMQAARDRGIYGTPDLSPHFAMAQLLFDQGSHTDGMKILKEALALGPNNTSAHLNFGLQHMAAGELTSAKMHLIRATKLDPYSATAYYHLAYLYTKLGDRMRAISALKRTVRLQPKNEAAQKQLQQLQGTL